MFPSGAGKVLWGTHRPVCSCSVCRLTQVEPLKARGGMRICSLRTKLAAVKRRDRHDCQARAVRRVRTEACVSKKKRCSEEIVRGCVGCEMGNCSGCGVCRYRTVPAGLPPLCTEGCKEQVLGGEVRLRRVVNGERFAEKGLPSSCWLWSALAALPDGKAGLAANPEGLPSILSGSGDQVAPRGTMRQRRFSSNFVEKGTPFPLKVPELFPFVG
jgi:hypothetical protein